MMLNDCQAPFSQCLDVAQTAFTKLPKIQFTNLHCVAALCTADPAFSFFSDILVKYLFKIH